MEAIDDIVDFKPNSALSVGTNVFLSGYWRKGQVISIDIDDSILSTLFKTMRTEKHMCCQHIGFIQLCNESLLMHIIYQEGV